MCWRSRVGRTELWVSVGFAQIIHRPSQGLHLEFHYKIGGDGDRGLDQGETIKRNLRFFHAY